MPSSPSRMTTLKSGAVFMDWKEEGIALLLQCPSPHKLRAWAKLMAIAPTILETAIHWIRTDTIREEFVADALAWKAQLQELQKEMNA